MQVCEHDYVEEHDWEEDGRVFVCLGEDEEETFEIKGSSKDCPF